MRELLKRWAELEPDRCHLKKNIDGFTINSGKWWDLLFTGNLPSEDGLMKVQYAVQQAIIARGWLLDLDWDGTRWEAWVNSGWADRSPNSAAEALLSAYLDAIEA